MSSDRAVRGEVDRLLLEEFPGLSVSSIAVATGPAPTPRGLLAELSIAADRINGRIAARAATGTVPAAYRALIRQLGVDPESVAGTAEAVMRRRLLEGGFREAGLLEDALALCLLEFGVPIAAFDGSAVGIPVDLIRASESGPFLAEGDIVLASGGVPVARLFGAQLPGFAPDRRSRTVTFVAAGAPGVAVELPGLALERLADLIAGGAGPD